MSNVEEEVAVKKKNKVLRVITGFIIGMIALAGVILSSVPLFIMLGVIVVLCSKEFVKILNHKGFYPSFTVILAAGIAFMTLIFFRRFELVSSMLTIAIMASFLSVLFKGRQPYIVNVATTILGALYCAWLPCHLLLVRQIALGAVPVTKIAPTNVGLGLLIFVFLAVAATDIGAYYFGVKFGKHKLAEVISPKKTIEGAIGGGLFAIFISALGVFYTDLSLFQAIVAGLIVTSSAQLGDLSESLIKRDAGVKDSSNILPGHGGMLDRFDGYIFAIPVAYYFFTYFCLDRNIFIEFFEFLKRVINVYF